MSSFLTSYINSLFNSFTICSLYFLLFIFCLFPINDSSNLLTSSIKVLLVFFSIFDLSTKPDSINSFPKILLDKNSLFLIKFN